MYSFLRLFKSTATASESIPLFEQEPIFKELAVSLEKLFAKENELKTADNVAEKQRENKLDKPEQSIEHKKYVRVHQLCDKIHQALNDYNRPRTDEDNPDHLNAILIQGLWQVIDDAFLQDKTTLNTHRQVEERQQARTGIKVVTTVGAGIPSAAAVIAGSATGVLAGIFMWAGMSIFGLTKRMSDNIIGYFELNDDKSKTATIKILEEIFFSLIKLRETNYFKFHIQKNRDKKKYEIDDYYCPITHMLMKNPVLCLLDCTSYERDAITQWLQQEPTSPITRYAIPDDCTVEDVLVPNPTLKVLIDRYIKDNPSVKQDVYYSKRWI